MKLEKKYAVMSYEIRVVYGVGTTKKEAIENANENHDEYNFSMENLSHEADELGACLVECDQQVYDLEKSGSARGRYSLDTNFLSCVQIY